MQNLVNPSDSASSLPPSEVAHGDQYRGSEASSEDEFIARALQKYQMRMKYKEGEFIRDSKVGTNI